ncbi:MAG TPA: pyridine nucleotide-disulfide oxidoreductase, partial [Holosporales bacterium]|nr:pyridine nucleotide-disulfide oxidoreductase [Holosporales bacterium]
MSKFILEIDNRFSHFGDRNAEYAGSVVKALASSKYGVSDIMEVLKKRENTKHNIKGLISSMDARVVSVEELAPNIVEIAIHAPLAAKNFEPGQFYKLQNYETFSKKMDDVAFTIEPIAVTGASVDNDQGIVNVILLQNGASSKLTSYLTPGEPVVLMGPTGSPTTIPDHCKKVLLVGGGLGNAVLFSIGQKFKGAGVAVSYFAAYKNKKSIFKVDEIQKAANHITWVCEEELDDAFLIGDTDRFVKGNIIDALSRYSDELRQYDHMIVIGSDKMMSAVAKFRFHDCKSYFNAQSFAIASINSPMQCMMQGVCGQCVQV